MKAPFGDFWLAGYSVDSAAREIRLRATDNDERRVTEIVFSGVAAYHFECDNFQSILGYIIEHPLASFIEKHAEQFRSGFRQSGWPLFWKDSVEDAVTSLQSDSVRAFEILTAFGLDGWVLAREYQTHAANDTPA